MLRAAAAVDEKAVHKAVDEAIRRHDAMMTSLRASMPYEKAVQEASAKFREALQVICSQAIDRRDANLLQTIGMMDGNWKEGFRGAQQLGELHPAWLEYRNSDALGALTALADGFAASMYSRQHKLAQRAVREVSFQRQLIQRIPTTTMELPAARRLLGEADVRRLRAGEPLILEPRLLLSLVSDEQMRRAHADLSRLVSAMAVASGAPCNTGAQTGFLPLFDGNGNGSGGPGAPGNASFDMHADTRTLLRVIASLPAEIERHGWPRPLSLPAFVQLACYSARNKAHYTPHLDRWEHETHNRREITILCYVNPDWDAARRGGCLRLHPNPLGSAPTVDVEPTCGRIVIFPSATQHHEVLSCTKGERLALTLWVDYAE